MTYPDRKSLCDVKRLTRNWYTRVQNWKGFNIFTFIFSQNQFSQLTTNNTIFYWKCLFKNNSLRILNYVLINFNTYTLFLYSSFYFLMPIFTFHSQPQYFIEQISLKDNPFWTLKIFFHKFKISIRVSRSEAFFTRFENTHILYIITINFVIT